MKEKQGREKDYRDLGWVPQQWLGPDMLHITFLGSYFLHCLVSAIKTEVKVS